MTASLQTIGAKGRRPSSGLQTMGEDLQPCRRSEPIFFSTPFAEDLSLDQISGEIGHDWLEDRVDEKDFITRFINVLTPREERVIRLRFGLGGVGEHTLREIGEMFGMVGGQRVAQIEQKALRKLRYRAVRTFPSPSIVNNDRVANAISAAPCASKLSKRRTAACVSANFRAAHPHSAAAPNSSQTPPSGLDAVDARRTERYQQWLAERDCQREHDAAKDETSIQMGDRPNRAIPAYQMKLYLREMAATEAARRLVANASNIPMSTAVAPSCRDGQQNPIDPGAMSGASLQRDIERAEKELGAAKRRLFWAISILVCAAAYFILGLGWGMPTEMHRTFLASLGRWRAAYGVSVGLSYFVALATLGCLLEPSRYLQDEKQRLAKLRERALAQQPSAK